MGTDVCPVDSHEPSDSLEMGDNEVVYLQQNMPNTSDESDLDEQNLMEEYQPLSLIDPSEEIETQFVANLPEVEVENSSSSGNAVEEIEQIWNEPRPEALEIELDYSKTVQIMNAMANITLPSSSIPQWATQIPEEKWKQELLDIIRQQKNK